MAYPVCNLLSMAGTNVDSYVVNVQATKDTPNGSFVKITGLVAGQNEVYTVSAPSDVVADEIYLIQSPELIEVNGLRVNLTDPTLFTNPANRPARAYKLVAGDEFVITDTDGITGATVVGQYVVPVKDSLKPAAAPDLTGNTKLACLVLSKTTVSVGGARLPATRMRVIKA